MAKRKVSSAEVFTNSLTSKERNTQLRTVILEQVYSSILEDHDKGAVLGFIKASLGYSDLWFPCLTIVEHPAIVPTTKKLTANVSRHDKNDSAVHFSQCWKPFCTYDSGLIHASLWTILLESCLSDWKHSLCSLCLLNTVKVWWQQHRTMQKRSLVTKPYGHYPPER